MVSVRLLSVVMPVQIRRRLLPRAADADNSEYARLRQPSVSAVFLPDSRQFAQVS